MKRKTVGFLAVGLMVLSLTGCGKDAKATNANIESEETIIVAENDSSENVITEDEVIINEETSGESASDTENDTFVFYPEFIGNISDEPYTSYEFEDYEEVVTVEYDTPIGAETEVGYIKAGSTIKLIEKTENDYMYRVENNTGIGFEYIYVLKNDLLTKNDMEEFIISNFIEYLNPTFLDEPEEDMECVEFDVERMTSSGTWDVIAEALDNGDFSVSDYTTFCVVCTDSDVISEYKTNMESPRYLVNCKVYYK